MRATLRSSITLAAREGDARNPKYGSDDDELPIDEVKRLMLDIETIMNRRGTGLVRATIDGSEKAFLISAGALVTFHVPIGTMDEDPDA